MGNIQVLDLQTAQSIAAGEVVERPASVIKELCENSLDAGADRLSLYIEQGGKKSIRVTDNGSGMSAEDAIMAFEEHATSKIRQITDLDELITLGFRGEALPTIAAVAKVTLQTRRPEDAVGTRVVIEGGKLIERGEVHCNAGTTLEVRDLFYNTPARFKFLKKDQTEAQRITEVVQEIALARPDVSLFLEYEGKEVLHTPGDNQLLSAIYAVFGQQLAKAMVPLLPRQDSMVHATGYLCLPEEARKSRNWQMFYVNGRPIKSPLLTRALEDGYKSTMMTGRFPAAVLQLWLPMNLVDVNVHPRKLEVRFWNESEVYRAVYEQVQNSLFTALRPPELSSPDPEQTALTADDNPSSSTVSAEPSLSAKSSPEKTPSPFTQAPDKSYLRFDLDGYAARMAEPARNYKTADEFPAAEKASETAPVQLSFTSEEAPAADDREATLQSLRRARFAGELFRTYLLFEDGDRILLIDQHAAHEKVLFEEAVQDYQKNQRIRSQMLLEPVRMEISPSDEFFIEEHRDFLEACGFQVDFFGPAVVLVRAVPIGREVLDPAKALRYLLDDAAANGIEQVKGETDLIYHMLATSSCKSAVKAHDRLQALEVEALRERLLELDNPFHCPHGRPVIVSIRRYDLEKMFKRIV